MCEKKQSPKMSNLHPTKLENKDNAQSSIPIAPTRISTTQDPTRPPEPEESILASIFFSCLRKVLG